MNVIKRNGTEVPFNPQNIINAVTKANNSIDDVSKRMSALQIRVIEEQVEKKLMTLSRAAHIEEIQDLVIHAIMAQQAYEVAQHYTEYRYKKALIRKSNSTDDAILALVDYENEDMKQENSNKNPQIASTQRDYIAGIVSRDITWRLLLPEDISEAQKQGILHFHDADYFMQHIQNCSLINLDDMLQNGTVITDTLIERPQSLASVSLPAQRKACGRNQSSSYLPPLVQTRAEHLLPRQRSAVRVGVARVAVAAEALRLVWRGFSPGGVLVVLNLCHQLRKSGRHTQRPYRPGKRLIGERFGSVGVHSIVEDGATDTEVLTVLQEVGQVDATVRDGERTLVDTVGSDKPVMKV